MVILLEYNYTLLTPGFKHQKNYIVPATL